MLVNRHYVIFTIELNPFELIMSEVGIINCFIMNNILIYSWHNDIMI